MKHADYDLICRFISLQSFILAFYPQIQFNIYIYNLMKL